MEESHSINTLRLFHKSKLSSRMHCRQLSNPEQNTNRPRPEAANRKRAAPQQDNARPHVSPATRTKLHELGWNPPPDHHPFPPIQNSLQGKSPTNPEDAKKHAENFPFSKPAKFHTDGTFKPPDRWTNATNNNESDSTKQSLPKHHLSLH